MADAQRVGHSHNKHERDAPGRHHDPEQLPQRDEIRERASIVPAAVSSLLSAPPDGAPTCHASAINRLPSLALRRQLANGLVRRHGNAYLQRVLTTITESSANTAQRPPLPLSDETSQHPEVTAGHLSENAPSHDFDEQPDLPSSAIDTYAASGIPTSLSSESADALSDTLLATESVRDDRQQTATRNLGDEEKHPDTTARYEEFKADSDSAFGLSEPPQESANQRFVTDDLEPEAENNQERRTPAHFETTNFAVIARANSRTSVNPLPPQTGHLSSRTMRGPPTAPTRMSIQPFSRRETDSPPQSVYGGLLSQCVASVASGGPEVARSPQASRIHFRQATTSSKTAMPSWLQREGDDSSGIAQGLLDRARGKAQGEQEALRGEAEAEAGTVEQQAQASGTELNGKAASDEAALQGTVTTNEGEIIQDASAQSSSIQQQASADAAQLANTSNSEAANLQQDGAATSAELQGDAQALQSDAQGSVSSAESDLSAESSALQAEGETGANEVVNDVTALDSQTNDQIAASKAATQPLIDERNDLQSLSGTRGADPIAIQKRLDDHQAKLDAAESEPFGLSGIEASAEQISEKATSLWSGITDRAAGLLERASGLAQSAANTIQQGFSTLQTKATSALSGLKERATSAWNGLKSVATTVWSGLKERGNAAWNGVKARATAISNAVKDRADTVWSGVKSAAEGAWQGVKSTVGPVVATIGQKAQRVIGSVQGILGTIGSILSGAIESLLGAIRRGTAAAVDGLKSRADRAWNLIKSTGASLWQRVKRTGTGLWQRIKSTAGRAWEGVKSVASKAWDGLKNAGTKAWNGLKAIGSRVWEGLKKGWEWAKGKARQGLDWLKGAIQKLKKTARGVIDFLKKKARDGLNWLKKQIKRVKDLLKRALDWLREKWKWLKSLLKIRLCLDDFQVFDRHDLEMPYFDHGIYIVTKGQVWDLGPPIGPTQVSHVVGGTAKLGFSGAAGPGMIRNLCLTLIPLNRQAIGEGSLHVPGSFTEELTLSALMGGGINAGGRIILQQTELTGGFTMNADAVGVDREKLTYDAGKVTLDRHLSLALCFKGTIQLGGEQRIILGSGPAPDPFEGPLGFGGKKRKRPNLGDLAPKPLGGNGANGASGPSASAGPIQDLGAQGSGIPLPGGGGIGFAPTPDIPQFKEKRRFTSPFNLPPFTNEGCRRLSVKIHYRLQNGVLLIPERIDFGYEEIKPDDLIRDMIERLPKPVIPRDDESDEDDDEDPDVNPFGDCTFAVHYGERKRKFDCTPPRCGAIDTFPFSHVTKEGPGCPKTFSGFELGEDNKLVNSGCSTESIKRGGGCKLADDGTLPDCVDDIGVCLAGGEKDHPPLGKSCTDKWEQKLFLKKVLQPKIHVRKNEIKVRITRPADGSACQTQITHTKTGGEGTGPSANGGGGNKVEPNNSGCDARPGFLFKAMIRNGIQPEKGDNKRRLGVSDTDVRLDENGDVIVDGSGMSCTPDDPKTGPKHRVPVACGGESPDTLFAIDQGVVNSTDGIKVNQDASNHANITNTRLMPLEDFRNRVKSTAPSWELLIPGKK